MAGASATGFAGQRRRRPGWAAALLSALLVACGEAASEPAAQVRDSAGVRIVEYPGAPEPAAQLRLSDEPIYRHGGRPGDRELARVAVGLLRADGSAVLVDVGNGAGAAHEVLTLAPDGALGAVLATSGQGPEEVRQVNGIHALAGDSLLVEDRGNGKLMVFAGDELATVVSLRDRPQLVRGLRVHGIAGDGGLLMATSSYSTNFPEEWLQGSLVRVDLGTLEADTVGEYDMAYRQDPEAMNPFRPDGLITASGGRFVTLRTDRAQITWTAPDGSVARILRWVHDPRPATDADLEPLFASMRADMLRVNPEMSEAEAERYVAEQRDRVRLPTDATIPMAQTIRGDGDGRVWLPVYQPTMSAIAFHPPEYRVVGADGLWLGTVQMPPRFRLLDVRGDRVLGVQLDELDVEHVVVYELIGG